MLKSCIVLHIENDFECDRNLTVYNEKMTGTSN